MNPVFYLWIAVALFVALGIVAYMGERYSWNGGICRQTGEPWVRFDTDSQGGRGYKDKTGCYVTWISWPFIDSGISPHINKEKS